jgi:hypothetical protein
MMVNCGSHLMYDYKQCHLEKINNLWYIMFPDQTKALIYGYKTYMQADNMLWDLIGEN